MAATPAPPPSLADFTPNDNSSRIATPNGQNQQHLPVPQAKSWRASVWRATLEAFTVSHYRPYRGSTEKMRLPPVSGDNVQKVSFDRMRPLTKEQLDAHLAQVYGASSSSSSSVAAAAGPASSQPQKARDPSPPPAAAVAAAAAAASSSSDEQNKKKEDSPQKKPSAEEEKKKKDVDVEAVEKPQQRRDRSEEKEAEKPSSVEKEENPPPPPAAAAAVAAAARAASAEALPEKKIPTAPTPATSLVPKLKRKLKISLYLGDCADAARDLFCEGFGESVLLMDAASNRHAGGGTTNGSRAQEEEMCRRSSLLIQLDTSYGVQRKNFYPLNSTNGGGGGIFVPKCHFYRAGANESYAALPKPFTIAVGAVAAPNKPSLMDEKTMHPPDAALYAAACKTFWRMASANGIRAVVPIALGCGAFCCPGSHCARIMAKTLAEECQVEGSSSPAGGALAKTSVEEARFAIFEDHNSMRQGGIFVPFAMALMGQFGEDVEIRDSFGNDIKQQVLQVEFGGGNFGLGGGGSKAMRK